MMTLRRLSASALALAVAMPVHAQEPAETTTRSFDRAATDMQKQLELALAELDVLRDRIAAEKLPLSRELRDLEAELSQVRLEYQTQVRTLDRVNLDLTNLQSEIKAREDEATYLSNLLSEYGRNFESRLHISELQRYEEALEKAKLAPENRSLSKREVYDAQANLLSVSFDRLFEALGGARFTGTAVDANGLVADGQFVLVGPAALFRSADGNSVGTAEQRLGSLEPAVIGFADPLDTEAAAKVVADANGWFPLDPTLGNAHKIAATEETFVEHVQKGGPVMIPIFAMAAAALLVALAKWLSLSFVRKPKRKSVDALLQAVASRDEEAARLRSSTIKGPVGKMLSAGVQHIREPRELIEEVMYETVLTTRLRVQRFLPFIAICAASAPLLGLLGTVTGIINTFTLITVFGSGDVKTLSGGISEALITTKFGLIVAIPSLLLHAFLSRKARSVVSSMETVAMRFVNQVSRTPFTATAAKIGQAAETAAPDPSLVREQVKEIVGELLGSLVKDGGDGSATQLRTAN